MELQRDRTKLLVDSSENEISFDLNIQRRRQQEIAEKQKQNFNNPLELASEDEIESLNHITMILKKHFANKRI